MYACSIQSIVACIRRTPCACVRHASHHTILTRSSAEYRQPHRGVHGGGIYSHVFGLVRVAVDALHRKGGRPSDGNVASPASGLRVPGVVQGVVAGRALDNEARRDDANGCRSHANSAFGSPIPRGTAFVVDVYRGWWPERLLVTSQDTLRIVAGRLRTVPLAHRYLMLQVSGATLCVRSQGSMLPIAWCTSLQVAEMGIRI